MRFIGSKTRLLPFIKEAWDRYIGPGVFRVGDLFCGTAAVSRFLKHAGHVVFANDNLRFGYAFGLAAIGLNGEPCFKKLLKSGEIRSHKDFSDAPPYDRVLTYLNCLQPQDGFIFQQYSPGGTVNDQHERRYFSDENARKIDAMRRKLEIWEKTGLVSQGEFCLLLADLMNAANRVANISGTFGCFNRKWDPRSRKRIRLLRSEILTRDLLNHVACCDDANNVVRRVDFDVLYLDPPYTWRQYAAYYHLLETIALGDEPSVHGITGLRPWRNARSRYSSKADAPNALMDLITHARTKHLLLSYNDQGLLSHSEILEILRSRGVPTWSETRYRPYCSVQTPQSRPGPKERLYYCLMES